MQSRCLTAVIVLAGECALNWDLTATTAKNAAVAGLPMSRKALFRAFAGNRHDGAAPMLAIAEHDVANTATVASARNPVPRPPGVELPGRRDEHSTPGSMR
jgi:hypothetical protein